MEQKPAWRDITDFISHLKRQQTEITDIPSRETKADIEIEDETTQVQSWDFKVLNRDLWTGFVFVMSTDGMVHANKLEPGKGFELLRQLLTKYDPAHPYMISYMRCDFFGYADNNCRNFNELAVRLEDIIALTDRMGRDYDADQKMMTLQRYYMEDLTLHPLQKCTRKAPQ